MRRWVLVGAVALVYALVVSALAAPPDRRNADEWDEVLARYGIRNAASVPEGITPLPVRSPAELRQVMQQITSRNDSKTEIAETGQARSAYGITESCVSLHKTKSWVPFPTFNLWAEVWIVGSGSFWEIDEVYEWVGLTGITVIADLVGTWTYHRISLDHRSVTIRGGGTLNHYFVIKGLIRVYSEPVALTIVYAL